VDLFVVLGLPPEEAFRKLAESPQDPESINGDRLQDSLELSRIPLNNGGDDVRTVMKRFVAERPLNVQKTNGVVFGQTKGGELEVSILQRVEDGDSVVSTHYVKMEQHVQRLCHGCLIVCAQLTQFSYRHRAKTVPIQYALCCIRSLKPPISLGNRVMAIWSFQQ
jgi:hypothetical protein